MYEKVLRPEQWISLHIGCFMVGDSTDSEGVYVRFIDMEQQVITTWFLCYQQLVGDPDAENIFQAIMQAISENGFNLPLSKLVGFTCDGASVMISGHQGVLGKLRRKVNCFQHTALLIDLSWHQKLPKKKCLTLLKTFVSDVLFYFRDSSTRSDQFKSLVEHADPEMSILQ